MFVDHNDPRQHLVLLLSLVIEAFRLTVTRAVDASASTHLGDEERVCAYTFSGPTRLSWVVHGVS